MLDETNTDTNTKTKYSYKYIYKYKKYKYKYKNKIQIQIQNTDTNQLNEQFNLGYGLLLQKPDNRRWRRQRVVEAKQTVDSQTNPSVLPRFDEKYKYR